MLKYKKPPSIKEFITITLTHFIQDPNRRCLVNGICQYSPPTKNSLQDNIGCAIGMWMTPKNKIALDENIRLLNKGSSITFIFNNPKLLPLLPPWMKKIPLPILQELQNCHDYFPNISNAHLKNILGLYEQSLLDTPL